MTVNWDTISYNFVSKNVVAYFELRLNWGSEENRGDVVTQVHLSVYDITHVNDYLCWSGIIPFWNILYVYSLSLLYNFVIWWKPFLWVCISWTIFYLFRVLTLFINFIGAHDLKLNYSGEEATWKPNLFSWSVVVSWNEESKPSVG